MTMLGGEWSLEAAPAARGTRLRYGASGTATMPARIEGRGLAGLRDGP
jgi:hypothetical protein